MSTVRTMAEGGAIAIAIAVGSAAAMLLARGLADAVIYLGAMLVR